MIQSLALPGTLLLVGYVGAFAVAAVACFVSAAKLRDIDDADTRRGLVWLLATSGAWALTYVGFFLAPGPALSEAFYLAGLIVGLSTVGPWLYFCSAYTGRTLHQDPTLRRIVTATFLVIVAVKVTNPVHGLYYSTQAVEQPFAHFAVELHMAHWLVMGLSYVLAAIGLFMLYELFRQVDYDTRPLVALALATGLPVVLDLLAFATPLLLDVTYEPLGVAVFAVGVAFVYLDRFQAVRLTGDRDQPTVLLDEHDHVREYNEQAAALFPELKRAADEDEPLWAVVPELADALDADERVVELDRNGTTYYQVTESQFAAGGRQLGSLVTLTDVSEREEYRRELERQNERLEQFASVVSHDIRNPLNVALARVEMADEECESDHLETALDALDRMEVLVEDLLTLAREGQPVDRTAPVSLASLARESWAMVEAPAADLVVERDATVLADADRLQQLLENLFRNSVEHAGPDVTVRVGPTDGGFYVADDGPGIPPEAREQVFESGYSTTADGTGFGLAIVAEIAEAHGWPITVGESEAGGARFEITGVETPE